MNRKDRRAGKAPPPSAPSPVAGLYATAVSHHHANRLQDAERLYWQVLSLDAAHADSYNRLGAIAYQIGKMPMAADLFAKAVALKPGDPSYHANLAVALQDLGRCDEAVAAGRKALARRRDFPGVQFNLGNALRDLGRFPEAVEAYRQAIRLRPDDAEAHANLGMLYHKQERLGAAADQAVRALCLMPSLPVALSNLGVARRDEDRGDEAVALFRRALAVQPTEIAARNNLGGVLREQGRANEAVECYRRVLVLQPDCQEALVNLGDAMQDRHEPAQVIAWYRRALALRSDDPTAHWNLALALLQSGDYRSGWDEFEWRWRLGGGVRPKSLDHARPRWEGQPTLQGTILLWAEQGYGDSLQFVRFAPLVAQLGWRILLSVPEPLRRLCQSVAGIEVIADHETPPPFDVHCPLLSLPRLLGTTLATIPVQPYLQADPRRVAFWRARLGAMAGRKIGIVWRGSASNSLNRARSIDAASLARCVAGQDAVVSLQKDATEAELAALGPVIDLKEDLVDFAETAAIIMALDLVVTIDTSVCHLAGALGKPTWILQRDRPDWRWAGMGERCAWYPTARLFRQTRAGEWGDVVSRIKDALEP